MNTLKMSILGQRASTPNANSIAKGKQLVSNLMKIDDNDNSINNEEEILSKIKVNALNKYYEDRIRLKNWITQIKIYFTFYLVLGNKKTLLISIFLQKRVQHWLKLNLRKHLKNEEDSKEIFINFDVFKKELRRVFEIFNEKQIAKRVI